MPNVGMMNGAKSAGKAKDDGFADIFSLLAFLPFFHLSLRIQHLAFYLVNM